MTSTDSNDDLINRLQRIIDYIDDLLDKTSRDSNNDLINQAQRVTHFISYLLNMILTDSNDDLINEAQTVSDHFNSLSDDTLTEGGNTDTIQSSQDDASSKVKLIIHNQFPGIELTSPVYAGRHVTCYLVPDQSINISSIIQVDFNINITRRMPTGVLMYKLQRKNINQSNEDSIPGEEEATCIQLVIIWIVNNSSKEFSAASYLLEHNEDSAWCRCELMKLEKYCKLTNIQYGIIEDTWLMHDNTVLLKRVNVTCEEKCYKLDMTISETSIKEDTQRPRYIDLNG
jgi:hypothetical protein